MLRTGLGLAGNLLLGLAWLLAVAFAAWGSLMLYEAGPGTASTRAMLAVAWTLPATVALVLMLFGRRRTAALALAGLAVPVLGWWLSLSPSNDRAWQPDVARVGWAEIDGDRVTFHNFRNFHYRSATDFDARWEQRTVSLRDLEAVDLIAVHWGSDAIAHTMVSFVFAGQPVTFSIEIRKEEGEAFSALAGFFRRYELIYVVGDERDLIHVRANVREPSEDVYLYRLRTPPENARRLFLDYVAKLNELAERPEFYNTATTNCTTNVLLHARAVNAALPTSWKVLLSGYFPEYAYERGALEDSMPFAELRELSRINERAKAAAGAPDFSQRIREGLPRPLPRTAAG